MGLRNDVWSIKQSIDQQAIEIKKTQEHQKLVEYTKNELESLLLSCLMQTQHNIYDDDVKAEIIECVVHNTDVLLYNRNYTRQYLFKKYYTIARQAEQVKKKTSENTSEQAQLKTEILQIKKLQEAEKLRKLQYQAQARQQKQISTKRGGNDATWIILAIIFFPLAIIYGFISAACKTIK